MLATGASAQQASSELPVIDVTGDGDGGGYQATSQTITRLPTPLLDTPQTINVVPQRVIQEQGVRTMEEALRNVPGITFSAGEGGMQGDAPTIRGFNARTDLFRDGMRDPGWYTRDLFSSDRVEVYKGPSAFAFGRGATGGAINTVSKLPTGASFIDGYVSVFTPKGVRAEVDASGKRGNISGRIAVMGQDVDTPDRDNVWTKRWGVAPSIAIDITPQTRATLSYIYQGEESVPDYGHPWLPAPTRSTTTGALTNGGYYGNGSAVTPVPVPRANWFGVVGGPLADVVKTNTHIVTGKLEHEIAPNLKITNATRYLSVDRNAMPTAPRSLFQSDNVTAVTPGYPVDRMTIGRQHFQTITDNTFLANQTDLNAKFNTGAWQHTLVAGAEFAYETRFQQRANYCTATLLACRTSVWTPQDTSYGGPNAGFGTLTETDQTTAAFYASDQIKLNQYFELLGAVRYDVFNTKYTDIGNAVPGNRELNKSDGLFSWRVGGVFHPTANSSIYAAYGVAYNPAAELGTLSTAPTNAANISLDPEKNRSIEVGAKAEILDGGRLSVSGAIFRIEKTNMRVTNDLTLPTAQQFFVLDGLARVDGVELGVAGKLTSAWQVFAGYSYLKSEIVETTNAAQRGNQIANTPPHSFSLWTTYDVTPALTVGGGATYQSDTFANNENTLYVPSYWRFDAMASYKVTKNATLQLNIYNISDEKYYAQYYGGHAVPAAGRWGALSLRVRY